MALCYKDKTFCDSDCINSSCFRFIYNGLWKEAKDFGLPVAVSNFSLNCEAYQKRN